MDVGIQVVRLQGADLVDLARRAEEAGLDALWLAGAGENYAKAAQAAEVTRRIRVGTCIAPLLLATPAFHAAMAAYLDDLSGGRFVLGVGSQTKGQLRRGLGVEVDHIVSRAGAAVEETRSRLAGRRVPIYFSGVGDLSLRAAGRHADGLCGHPLFTRRYLEAFAWPAVRTGLERSGRDGRAFRMVALAMCLVGPETEREALRNVARRNLAYYFTTRAYGTYMDRHGWSAPRRAIGELAARSGRRPEAFDYDAMALHVGDDIVDEVCLVGTPDEVRARAAERYEGVADAVALYPVVDPGLAWADARAREAAASLRAVDAFAAPAPAAGRAGPARQAVPAC